MTARVRPGMLAPVESLAHGERVRLWSAVGLAAFSAAAVAVAAVGAWAGSLRDVRMAAMVLLAVASTCAAVLAGDGSKPASDPGAARDSDDLMVHHVFFWINAIGWALLAGLGKRVAPVMPGWAEGVVAAIAAAALVGVPLVDLVWVYRSRGRRALARALNGATIGIACTGAIFGILSVASAGRIDGAIAVALWGTAMLSVTAERAFAAAPGAGQRRGRIVLAVAVSLVTVAAGVVGLAAS